MQPLPLVLGLASAGTPHTAGASRRTGPFPALPGLTARPPARLVLLKFFSPARQLTDNLQDMQLCRRSEIPDARKAVMLSWALMYSGGNRAGPGTLQQQLPIVTHLAFAVLNGPGDGRDAQAGRDQMDPLHCVQAQWKSRVGTPRCCLPTPAT